MNCRSFNKIYSLVAEIQKFKKLNLKTLVSNMRTPVAYWNSWTNNKFDSQAFIGCSVYSKWPPFLRSQACSLTRHCKGVGRGDQGVKTPPQLRSSAVFHILFVLNCDRSTVKHALQNTQNNRYKWLSNRSRVHPIRFRPELRPGTRLADLRGPTFNGSVGKGRGKEGMGRKGGGRGGREEKWKG